jgi:hypothetical protein
MKREYYWIKERHNGQTAPYFVEMGAMPTKEAMKHEQTLAGYNVMHRFTSLPEYEHKLAELKLTGKILA